MGFFTNLFTSAGEKAQLTREVLLYKGLYERELEKNALLEKAVISERNKKDKFVSQFCDQISKQQGLPPVFKEKVERPKEEPEPLSVWEQEILQSTADAMMQADIEEFGSTDRPPEAYYAAVVARKHEYLNGR